MCDVNDPRILNAYIAITEDEPTDWLLLGYKDTRDKISLYASGVNGLSEFREHITNEILFGFVRVDDRFILITYVPDSVSGVRRARALVHSRSVANILELSHAQFTASTLSDMSDANIRTRLKLGQNQVPNRPRSMMNTTPTKRTSVIARRRKSTPYVSPSPSPSPSPMSERNLKIFTTEEPFSYDDHDRSMSVTPTPSTPTSVASSFAESSISTVIDNTFDLDGKRDATEAMLQMQLAKKKELEEARFRQFQKDQQEERFKRDQALKRFEQEEKEKQQKLKQDKPSFSLNKRELQTKRSFNFQKIEEEKNVLSSVILRKVGSPTMDSKRKSSIVAPVVELKKVAPEALKYNYSRSVAQSTKKEIKRPESYIDIGRRTPTPPVIETVIENNAAKKLEPVVENNTAKKIIEPVTVVESKIESPAPAVAVAPAVAPTVAPAVVVVENSTAKKIELPVVVESITAKPEPIVKPKEVTKEVLMTGFASVQTHNSPLWRRRYFVIQTDSVSLYKDEMANVPISIINLSHVTRLAPANEDEDTYVPNSFVMDSQTGDAYQIFADEKKTFKKMYSIIQSCL